MRMLRQRIVAPNSMGVPLPAHISTPKFLDMEQCQEIVDYAETVGFQPRGNSDHCIAQVASLPDAGFEWLYTMLAEFAWQVNYNNFNFSVNGILEDAVVVKYTEGSKYDWHCDLGHQTATLRKISMVANLSNRNDYVGGALEFLTNDIERCEFIGQGDMTVYPAYLSHRTTRVDGGTRYMLAAWVSGERFV